MNIGTSIIVYFTLFSLAPYIAAFYNQEILIELVRVYSICFIFSAISSVQIAILMKEMKFKRLTMLNLPGAILGSLVGLIMGYMGYGVWSIIVMYITTQA